MSVNKRNILIAVVLILVAAILKVATYPNSINPIVAIALFSGAIFQDKKLAFFMPLMAMLAADILLEVSNIAPGFYGMGQIANYLCLMAVTLLGFAMKKINIASVAGFSIASTLLFFVLSNSSVFAFSAGYYEMSFAGYIKCMAAGVPFMLRRLPIDLLFSAIFFGSYVYFFAKNQQKAVA